MASRTAVREARAERAAATRARIVAAATTLFVEHGYLDTTMAAIARAAGVAVQTLYLSFGSKVAVLEAAWAATEADQPSGWLERLRAAPDGPAMLARYVADTAAALERRAALAGVLSAAAADPEPAAVLAAARAAELARHAAAIDELAEQPDFTYDITVARATEVTAALLAPDSFALLVGAHGWSVAEWADWTTRHLCADLFPRAVPIGDADGG